MSRIIILTVAALSLVALFLAYLFPFHLEPWTTFYNDWLFSIFLIFSSGLIIFFGSPKLVNPWYWVGFAVCLALHMVFFNPMSPHQLTLFGVGLVFLVLAYLAYSLGVNLQAQKAGFCVLGVIWLAATISALLATLQWSGVVASANWDPGFILFSEGGGRVSSNIGQANNLGTLLVMGVGCLGYFYTQGARRSVGWKVFALCNLFLLVLGVYLSGSRTANLNLLLWPVLMGVWAWWRHQSMPWMAVLPIGLLTALQVLMPPLIEWWGLFPAMEARSLVSDGQRLRLWSMVWSAIAERPWLGHGFGAVANAHLRLSPEFGAFDYTIAQHAHNTLLDLWVVLGLPLGTLMAAGVLWMWGRAWWCSVARAQQYVWLMTTAMLVHAMLEYPLHYGFFFWMLCLLLGALGGKPWKTISPKWPGAWSVAWIVVFLTAALTVRHAYVQTEALYTQYRQQGPAATHETMTALKPGLGQLLFPELYERLFWLTTPMDEVLSLNDMELARLEAQASAYPLPSLGWRMAFVYGARGNAERAAWWAQRMCKMFDPQVCQSAREEWGRRGQENQAWPRLPWEQWIPAESVG